MATTPTKNGSATSPLGFEQKLWAAADALRNNMDAAEYKHVVLGLIFLMPTCAARQCFLRKSKAHNPRWLSCCSLNGKKRRARL